MQVEAKVAEVEVSTIDDSSRLTYRIEFSGSGMSDATLENLFANLKQLGNLESLTPASVIDLCKLKLTTDKSEEDIWETLAFVVDPATLIIVVDSLNKNEATAIEPDKTNSVSIDAKSIVDEDEFSMTDMPPAPGYGFFPGAPAAPKDIDDAESSLNSPQQLSANNSKNEANATLNKSSSKAIDPAIK